MTTPTILIACKIFCDELQSVLPARPDLKVVWIDAALHANLDRLEEELKTALAQAAACGAEVQILLGDGCHPNIVSLARDYGAHLPPIKNCIEAFLGLRQRTGEKCYNGYDPGLDQGLAGHHGFAGLG